MPKGPKITYLYDLIAGVEDQPDPDSEGKENEYDEESTSSTASEDQTKLVEIINGIKGHKYDDTKSNDKNEEIESDNRNRTEI